MTRQIVSKDGVGEGSRGVHSCEAGRGFNGTRKSTEALHGGRWAQIALCVCLLAFASLQQVSADGDNVVHLPAGHQLHEVSHQALFHRALAGGGVISQQLQTDRDTLLNWKQHWISVPSQNPNVTQFFAGWNGSSPCGWQGIVCGSSGPQGTRVTEINLVDIGIMGPMPDDGYANLSACTSLVLPFNQINGTMPATIASMASLQVLDLSLNLLNGGIPPEFEGLFITQLMSLNLSSNNLSVPIPPTLFSACGSLKALNLSVNSLSGNLPSVGKCTSLTLYDMWQNQFSGNIRPEMGLLPFLQYITLAENQLTGPIPPEFFANCGSMISLQLSRCQLTGPIPSVVGTCANLQIFNVQENKLTGTIPPSLGNLTQLNTLAIGNNAIHGTLPEELSNLANLQNVDFTSNQISGSIPLSYSKLVSMVNLALQENLLVGTFPLQLTKLNNLRLLDLSHNQFTGPIPSQLGLCTTLTQLLLAYNSFSGVIPVELGSLSNLQVLDLSFNKISGSIPQQLGNLKSLLWLQLSNNQLTGSIPPELGGCSSLVWLNLCHNGLTGSIPDTFASIGQSALQTFIGNRNNIPLLQAELGECGALIRWIPGTYEPFSFLVEVLAQQSRRCRVQWNLLLKGQLHPAELNTPLAYMQLSYNKLSGPIPKSIGYGGKFSILFLDHNELSGSIPDTLNQIPLFNLNLSNNMLSGSIPASLGSSQHLLSADLSFNKLADQIPPELENLTFMDKFNVSYNNLSGPVPTANQFATYALSSYVGNPYLCSDGNPYSVAGDQSNILQQCGAHSYPNSNYQGASKSKRLGPKEILGITLGCLGAAIFAAGCIYLTYASRRPKHLSSIEQANAADSRFKKVGQDQWFHSNKHMLKIPVSAFGTDVLPKALAYRDLLVATGNFDDSNIIGDGGFGVVYKAKLSDQSVVAVKKLHQDGAQGEGEFAAEMLTLGNIRHENLVPLLGYCVSEREKLLVYKCMTNGSLEEWLHDRPGGKQVLTWAKRVNIAAGAARGVAFLHHSCSPVVIHRDMKLSNILLDDNFCAYVTDFGLARRMYGQDTHVSTIVAGTLGYVPPEYSQTWRSTTKGDVYSFGVVLLELITARRPTGADFDDENGSYLGGNVVEWVRILLAKRRHEEAYDPAIKNQGASQELIQFLKLAVVCTEDSPNNRPAMTDVSKALDQIQLSVNMRSPSQAFP